MLDLGTPAHFHTHVRVLFDHERLYVAAILHDSTGERLAHFFEGSDEIDDGRRRGRRAG